MGGRSLEIAQPALISVVTAVITAVVTVRLSLHNFYSQKWWEKQAEVYSEILASLAHMQVSSEYEFDSSVGFPSTEEQKKIQSERWRKSKARIEQITNIGAFIISETVHEHLVVLQKKLEANKEKTDWHLVIESELTAVRKAIKAIRECAKRELKRDPWWKLTF